MGGTTDRAGVLAEWRAYPMLPIAAAFGYATSVIHIYGFGPYIAPVSAEFGWSRAMVTVCLLYTSALPTILRV